MISVLSDFYKFTSYNKNDITINQVVDQIITLNNNLRNNLQISSQEDITYQLNTALLNRFRSNYIASISQLESLNQEITNLMLTSVDSSNLIFHEISKVNIEKWLCYVRAEYDLVQDLINHDEFSAQTENCGVTYKSALVHQELLDKYTMSENYIMDNYSKSEITSSSEKTISESLLLINPNPNEGSFTVHLVSNSANNEIKIFNALGQLIKSTKVNKLGEQIVTFNNIAKGQYTVVYVENGNIINSEKLLVK